MPERNLHQKQKWIAICPDEHSDKCDWLPLEFREDKIVSPAFTSPLLLSPSLPFLSLPVPSFPWGDGEQSFPSEFNVHEIKQEIPV